MGTRQTGARDDSRYGASFGLEDVTEVLAEMVGEQAVERPRDAELITCRLGLDGESPETLTLLGVRFGVSRDRARQLYTRAVGTMVRRVQSTGQPDLAVFAERYPVGWGDERLVRTLLAETYATDNDIAAQDWAYLKLRLAGHDLQESKRLAGFVFQRIAGWQQKGRWHLLPQQQVEDVPAGVFNPWLRRVEWGDGSPAELPEEAARTVDIDDDGRGTMFAEKLGREVTFDTGMQQRLLRLLDGNERVDAFRELPAAVTYEVDGGERIHYPTVAAQFADGRVVLMDVIPLGQVAFHVNRLKAAAGRAYAHAHGWGWLVWTGGSSGVADLMRREVDSRHETQLRNRLASGPVGWDELRAYREDTGIELLDLAAMTLRNEWRWDRGPFRLSRTN
ncbi:hypothetical protein H0264_29140 [Nocardia huaxiensis]|uniref:RNA polymerase sigma-70 region 4 domain-containing protein n=1 Tax=Nocardia huaxiensis TaxID=2755382 RepID=A0A7D6V970_9NOCA|nr:hypothetical protein [Nocardia huaxiensis]QLY29311.1 hypothetical protein H0264_29140 [Nocardia huaxiensis]